VPGGREDDAVSYRASANAGEEVGVLEGQFHKIAHGPTASVLADHVCVAGGRMGSRGSRGSRVARGPVILAEIDANAGAAGVPTGRWARRAG